MDDLKGKTVVAVAGTTNLRQLGEINAQQSLGMSIFPVKSHHDAFATLEDGKADAYFSDDIILYGMIANASSPADYVVSAKALRLEPYGIMMRKDDPAFKQVADDAIRSLFKSGEIQTLYKKWFLSPIPPKNVILNVPMSASLKKSHCRTDGLRSSERL